MFRSKYDFDSGYLAFPTLLLKLVPRTTDCFSYWTSCNFLCCTRKLYGNKLGFCG